MTGESRRKRASSTEVLPEARPKTAQLGMFYHVMMKCRVALSLDEDVVQALETLGGRSLSSTANDALRAAVALEAHRAALGRWLDELDVVHGAATPEETESIGRFVDDLTRSAIGAEVA